MREIVYVERPEKTVAEPIGHVLHHQPIPPMPRNTVRREHDELVSVPVLAPAGGVDYLRLRRLVLVLGVDVLPTAEINTGHRSEAPPSYRAMLEEFYRTSPPAPIRPKAIR